MEPRASFWKLLTDGKSIEIPSLQRDYTHGRSGDSPAGKMATQVRRAFLDSIDQVLNGAPDSDACLDFMFGPQTSERFLPIDGQQRLTTLFLYHWYLIPESEDKLPLSRFKYHTRDTSNAFCQLLADTPRSSIADSDTTISRGISDLGSFFLRWKNDPSVQGMLTVLDEIHARWKDKGSKVYDQAWTRLTAQENPAIYFFIPDRNENQKKDAPSSSATIDSGAADLYIRMNARGKPLTPFEKFKAWLEEYVEKPDGLSSPMEITKWEGTGRNGANKSWKALLDSEWTDLFWEHDDGNHIVDEEFLRFFTTIAVCDYAREKEFTDNEATDTGKVTFKSIAPDKNDETYVPTHLFETHHIFNDWNLRLAFEVLDGIALGGETHLRNAFHALGRWIGTHAPDNHPILLEGIVSPSPATYNDRVRFFALAHFIASRSTAIREGDEDIVREVARLARIVDNIVGNLQTESDSDFANRIKQINRLLDRIEENVANSRTEVPYSVYNAVANLSDADIKEISGRQSGQNRLQDQLTEESRKCRIIVNDPDPTVKSCESVIVNAESKTFTRGRIAFLLDYAEKTADTDEGLKATLDQYASFIDVMFHENRTIYDSYENDNTPLPAQEYRSTFWLRRALLTKGYFNFETGHNWSFCGNPSDAAAERRQWYSQGFTISHGDNEPLMYRLFVDVSGRLGKQTVTPETVRNSFRSIVDDYLSDHRDPNDWRWWFISYRELFSYSDYNETQWHHDDALTYLLKRRRLNGRHVEIVSYSFYRDALRNCPAQSGDPKSKDRGKAFPPFQHFSYYEPTNGTEPPCMHLDITIPSSEGNNRNYAMDVRFEGNSHVKLQGEIVLRFFDRDEGGAIRKEVVTALTSKGFTLSRNDKLPGLEYRVKVTPETWLEAPRQAINETCSELSQVF